MASLKQNISVRVSGVDQDGTNADTGFTSDPIEFVNNFAWVLNVWFTGLNFPGSNHPEVTIEVSNSTDLDSFRVLEGAEDIEVPELFEMDSGKWRYMRIIYNENGTNAGTKNFDLIQLK